MISLKKIPRHCSIATQWLNALIRLQRRKVKSKRRTGRRCDLMEIYKPNVAAFLSEEGTAPRRKRLVMFLKEPKGERG